MRLSALCPLLLPLCCAVLAVASPGISSTTAGPNMTPETSAHNKDGFYNYTVAEHSLWIKGLSSKDTKKDIVVNETLHLKLQCHLVVDNKDLQINVSWRHGKEQISSNLYTYNNTDNQWNTTYEFVVTDMSKTGDYICIFSSVNGTFTVQAPPVHGGSKAVVSYIGDNIVVKCDASNHNPLEWLWYKVNESEQVPLNFSSEPKRYEELSKTGNETRLQIKNLSESDNGVYVCKAIFNNVESEGKVQITVLSYMVPLKVFFVIVGEVIILVTIILVYEVISKKKQGQEDDKKDYEPVTQLKSEDSSIAEACTTRQRKA